MYDTPRADEIMMDLEVEYFGDLDVGISLMKVSFLVLWSVKIEIV